MECAEPFTDHIPPLPAAVHTAFTVTAQQHPERRFPTPWPLEDNGSCLIVKDHGGQTVPFAPKRRFVYADKASLFGGGRFARS